MPYEGKPMVEKPPFIRLGKVKRGLSYHLNEHQTTFSFNNQHYLRTYHSTKTSYIHIYIYCIYKCKHNVQNTNACQHMLKFSHPPQILASFMHKSDPTDSQRSTKQTCIISSGSMSSSSVLISPRRD